MRIPSRKPGWQKDIAEERIQILFSLAAREFASRPGRAHRYVELARRVGKRYNVKMPKDLRHRFCKKCNHYLKPGVNARIRASPNQRAMVLTCLDCGQVMRFPYRREKGERQGKGKRG